ncbi:MAG: hypothetical protein IPI71_00725 [Methanolinea sp.]|nr:MAG: hypothetical protein IPI71_00725 [Methanolinea sp.]
MRGFPGRAWPGHRRRFLQHLGKTLAQKTMKNHLQALFQGHCTGMVRTP